MTKVRALVVTGYGINCEEEMAAAYHLAGAEADIVHLHEVFSERISIHDYDLLNFPGGFAFGDDLGSAKVLSNKFKYKKMASGKSFIDDLHKFLSDKKYVMGVCNGFQALVKMGLIPNVMGNYEQETTLTHNNSGRFEDRWVTCKANEKLITPFLKSIDLIDLPVRHGEGKLIFKDQEIRTLVEKKNLNCLSYAGKDGHPTDEYPVNPNGSELNCAGLCDESGHVFGLMPHPEAFLSLYNHPDWGRMKRVNTHISEEGQGLEIFKNIIKHIMEK
ncbi:MAG: phosphoribosylformylglycinamidine synthase subunit PurQ [Calditrichaceae bacterium]|nr:phosphoribosylformylglycinamidine synthase subunit PurQ [Calditrichaceae bacterium]RQV96683.1 MAG: phosphoribosylformylglycinamidine synthase subunit PurQ [Calditrichota bacterium]